MKSTKTKKIETFIYEGLGFPLELIDVPMRKIFGEWVIDVDMNKLQLVVLRGLIDKPTPLTGGEVKFMRKFLDLSMVDFGKIFGVTHVAVVKWESGQTNVSPSMDVYIRLYILDHLRVKDEEFRALYHNITLSMLSSQKGAKNHPIVINAADDLLVAL